MRRFSAASLLLFAFTAHLRPQSQSQAPGLVIRRTVQEVMVDLVVRDKHERIVRDLKAGEVEIYEDGVKQTPRSFRLVAGSESRNDVAFTPRAAGTPAPKINAQREINLVILLFRMVSGVSERQVAREAAEDFLRNEIRSNTYVGVFSLDYRLNALQQFTNDPDLLRKAVRQASTGAYREFAKTSDAVLNAVELEVSGSQTAGGMVVNGGQINTHSAAAATAGADTGTSPGANIMRALLATDRRVFAGAEGLRQIDALKVMVQQLSLLPGRKTVIMLTGGLQLPPDQLESFDALKGIANRHNVTFYAVDVHGLSATSANMANVNSVQAAASISGTQGMTAAVSAGQALQDDIIQYGLRAANQQEALRDLATSTGGFLIASNDLRKPLTKIMEDVNTHYEVAYSPSADIYDGHFRKIEVKVLRAGIHIQSRNGYFALPDLDGKPVEPFEVAALRALETKPAPHDVLYRVAIPRFRAVGGMWQQTIAFEVPNRGLTATAVGIPPRRRIHVSFLAVIKDTTGQIVEKISRDIPYEIPGDKLDAFLAGNLSFARPFSLPPGRYTVDTAVIDREAGKAATRKISLVLPAPDAVSISTVSLVRRVDSLTVPADPVDPFQFATSKVTPSLDNTIPKGSDVTLYFVVYPSASDPEPARVLVQYLRDGKEIGRSMPEVNAKSKDESGAVPLVASAKLDPGQYDVTVTVVQGKNTAQQATSFTVED